MKLRRFKISIILILSAFCITPILESCGTMHSYWGVENDYYESFDGHGHHPGNIPKRKNTKSARNIITTTNNSYNQQSSQP